MGSANTCQAFDCKRPGVLDTATGGYFCAEFHLANPRSIRREMANTHNAKTAKVVTTSEGTEAPARVEGAVNKLWSLFDEMSTKPKAEVIKHCVSLGFKPNTVKTQHYYWRTGRVGGKKPEQRKGGRKARR